MYEALFKGLVVLIGLVGFTAALLNVDKIFEAVRRMLEAMVDLVEDARCRVRRE